MHHVRPLLFVIAFSILSGSAFAGLAVSAGTVVHTHSDANTGGATLAIGGAVSSLKTCASGYTRITPNFCRRSGFLSGDAFVDATACTSRTISSAAPVPAEATAVLLRINWQVRSNNAIGYRTNDVFLFPNAACTANTETDVSSFGAQEAAAIVAGTIFGTLKDRVIVVPSGTNTIHTTQTNAGGNGNADIVSWVSMGYYD